MSNAGTPQPPAKRRRASRLDDDDDGRKRGRPRVEKNDESAADRRRTQIRMAQRAYRQRKESTLEELRRRVNELTGVVDSMDTAFQDGMQRIISLDLPDAAVTELQVIASRLAGLKTSSQAKELDLSEDGIIERTASESVPQPDDALVPKNVSIWLDETELKRPIRRPRVDDSLDVGLGYSLVLPESVTEEASFRALRSQTTRAESTNGNLDGVLPDVLSFMQSSCSTHLITGSELHRTHSLKEPSFARRVHRACLEAAYSLLLDPSRDLQTYERVFRLPLLARDRAELIACAKTALNRGVTETLDLYEAPLIHIGGAGTHYARRDSGGRKVAHNPGVVAGPLSVKLLTHANGQRTTADMALDIEGLEGEWFDPYDVEGYLIAKGIRIEPAAAFHTLGDTATSSTGGTPGHSHSSDGRISRESSATFDAGSIPWNSYPGVASNNPDTMLDRTWANVGLAARKNAAPAVAAAATDRVDADKKTTVIDVTRLIQGLIKSAICLGQTPGFRRKDVDRALAYSCFEVY